MNTVFRNVSLVLLGAVVLTGCGTITGRSFGQYMDDQSTRAKVKTRLATAQAGTLTRVIVDTYNGVVYLNGVVNSEEDLNHMAQLAESNGARVVNNLQVRRPGMASARIQREDAAASPRMETRGQAAMPGMMGEAMAATMRGEITDVDHGSGRVTLRTTDGSFDLQFPPAAVRDLRQGDQVRIGLMRDRQR
jgi:enamine deaminase RidA (YjgF/YER057c/UK114 family)